MTCTIEKVLADARLLVNRLKEHDNAADNAISQAQNLNKRVDGMKQYQEDINELNEIARHKPRSNLLLGLVQENNQIRELQQQNKELYLSLEEHQSALQLIMSKYREQILKLIMVNKLQKNVVSTEDQSKEIQKNIERICEMVEVMQKAAAIDDEGANCEHEQLSRLKVENKGLRELLQISSIPPSIPTSDKDSQTLDYSDDDSDKTVIENVIEKS